jgi:Ankyrin repeats (3 copies)
MNAGYDGPTSPDGLSYNCDSYTLNVENTQATDEVLIDRANSINSIFNDDDNNDHNNEIYGDEDIYEGWYDVYYTDYEIDPDDLEEIEDVIQERRREEDDSTFERFAALLGRQNYGSMILYNRIQSQIAGLLNSVCQWNRNIQIVRLLLTQYNAAATLNTIRGCHNTALHYAVRIMSAPWEIPNPSRKRQGEDGRPYRLPHHMMELIQVLLQYGADVNIKSKCHVGMTPFHSSILEPMPVMKLLYQYVEDINVCDNYGRTPLQWAILEGNGPAVRLLLSHPNIDLDKKDYINNFTPLRLAMSFVKDDEDDICENDSSCCYTRMEEIRYDKELVEIIKEETEKRTRHRVYSYLLADDGRKGHENSVVIPEESNSETEPKGHAHISEVSDETINCIKRQKTS